ncbi:MAG: penicillin-binding transpeptidase domain-containing protein [Clostridia bacterium]|nr:penicillin-binding transpeptidase domain-containing protein [Clostridia bacterium]
MKKLRTSVRLISTLLIVAFAATAVFLCYSVYTQGGRWLTTQYNSRLTAARNTVGMGTVYDRDGVRLAYTDSDGQRQYSADEMTRRALSQTVGDQMSMSGTGVETFHANILLGLSGSIIDRTWQYVTGKSYKGDNIRLTVDAELTSYISSQFPSGKAGAVVVINYKTGEILSMVSKPDYDPLVLATRQASADTTGSGYLNRCLQGLYAPGSTFKIVTLAAALENISDVDQVTYNCTGPIQLGNGTVSCFAGEVHGSMTLWQAFAQSCNVTFARLAAYMGGEKLIATAERMGFNDNFRFRDLVVYESSIPDTIDDAYELGWTGDGQGRLLVTPLHMAMITGAIANSGVMREPALIAQVTGVGGIPRIRASAGIYGSVVSSDVADKIAKAMQRTVQYGTATRAAIDGYTVCGKTGTAEVSDDPNALDNAWFVGFIDDDAHPYAISVVVEEGGTGGSVAAPLAAKALRKAIDTV